MTFFWLSCKRKFSGPGLHPTAVWGCTKMAWVQTDHGVEDLTSVVAGWHDVMNIDQFYLMVDGRILPHDSSASLAFLGVREGCKVRVQARLRVWKWRRWCGRVWRMDVLQSCMSWHQVLAHAQSVLQMRCSSFIHTSA